MEDEIYVGKVKITSPMVHVDGEICISKTTEGELYLDNIIEIEAVLIHDDSILPEYKIYGDSGCDLISVEGTIIKPMQRMLVGTGLTVAIPIGYEIQIRPRSGNAWKRGLTVLNTPGTIDSGYRGEIKVLLINLGHEDIAISPGDAIAQAVATPVRKIKWKKVDKLRDTDRSAGGFGHTGTI